MNSPHQREQLPDVLSDALDATERARVEAHLRQCPQCARELRELQQMQATLASLPVAPVPARVRENVRAVLREEPRKFALPFAFPLPTRQLAWGGTAVVAAVGLMLLARPSLQQGDAFSQSSPISDSEIAARSARSDGAAPPGNLGSPPKSASSRQNSNNSTKTRAISPKTQLKPEVAQPAPVAPPIADAPADNSAPDAALPSFAFPAPPRPISPPKQPNARPVAPTDSSPAPGAPSEPSAPKTTTTPQTKIAPKQATAPQTNSPKAQAVAPPKNAPPTTEEPAPPSDATPNARAAPPAPMMAPSLARDNARAEKRDQNGFASDAPGAVAPRARVAPAPLAQENRASNSALTSNWPGGAVTATFAPRANEARNDTSAGARVNGQLAPTRKAPMVLTLSVAKPIGNARLILLAPDGESTIWRGDLNELPAQIEISLSVLDQFKTSKVGKLRARLEQIDGEGNPKSSSVFEIPLP